LAIAAFTFGATYDATKWSVSSTYARPDVLAPSATGVAATDTANLQAAINACPTGGTLLIPRGEYKVNATLTVTQHLSIIGSGVAPNFVSGASIETPTGSPSLVGTVVRFMTAATNAIDLTGALAQTVNIEGVGIIFDSSIAGNTGHGIISQHLFGFKWKSLIVYGHDGNHYAYSWANPLMGWTERLISYGGGGFFSSCTDVTGNYGNTTHIQPLSIITNGGAAHGFGHSSASSTFPGILNLLTYIRPQCNMESGNGTQRTWHDTLGAGIPQYIVAIAPDLEVASNFIKGAGTQWIGYGFVYPGTQNNTTFGYGASWPVSGATDHTAIGASALANLTSGLRNTAVGSKAARQNSTQTDVTAIGANAGESPVASTKSTQIGSQSNASNSNSTAIGYGAKTTGWGSVAIGCDSATTSATSSVQDEFVLGTALHRVKILGRLNVAPRTPTSGADASGLVGDIVADDNYVYAKTSTGWKRSAITTW
jgi:Head domain of trimeric autotransporter adhesin